MVMKSKLGYLLCGIILLLAVVFAPVRAEGALVTSSTEQGRSTIWNSAATWDLRIPLGNDDVVIGGQVEQLIAGPSSQWQTAPHAVTLGITAPTTGTLASVGLGGVVPAIGTPGFGVGARTSTAGTLTIGNNGVLNVGAGGFALGASSAGTLNMSDGGVLNVAGNITLAGVNTGNITIGGPGPLPPGYINITGGGEIQGIGLSASNLTFNHASDDTPLRYQFPSRITGNVFINHVAGTTELTNPTNTHTGGTTINNFGSILAFMPGALGSGTVTVQNSGTLRWLNSAVLGASPNPSLVVGTGTLDTGPWAATITEPIGALGGIGGFPALTKEGTGTLTIGAPGYNVTQPTGGVWTVEEGTLKIASGSTLFVDSMVNIGENSSLNVNGVLDVDSIVNVMDGGFHVNSGGVVDVNAGGTLELNNSNLPLPLHHLDTNNHVIFSGGTLNIDVGGTLTIRENTGLVIFGNVTNLDTIENYGIIWIPYNADENELLGNFNLNLGVFGRLGEIRRIPHGAGFPGGGGGGDGSDAPGLGSGLTEPTRVWTVLNGITYTAVRQPGGSFLLTVPAGTNISALSVFFGLPPMATMRPANGSVQNFSAGPVTYTITAANRVTTRNIDVRVVVEGGGAPGDGDNGDNVGNVGGSGSSGCNAGFAALGLLLAVPFFVRKRS